MRADLGALSNVCTGTVALTPDIHGLDVTGFVVERVDAACVKADMTVIVYGTNDAELTRGRGPAHVGALVPLGSAVQAASIERYAWITVPS